MSEKLQSILSQSECLSEADLLNYLYGAMPNNEKHRIEKHLSHCEMCSDAVEGYSTIDKETAQQKIAFINQLIHKKSKNTKVISLRTYFSLAAGVLLLFTIGYFFNRNLEKESSEKAFTENFTTVPLTDTQPILQPETPINSSINKDAQSIPTPLLKKKNELVLSNAPKKPLAKEEENILASDEIQDNNATGGALSTQPVVVNEPSNVYQSAPQQEEKDKTNYKKEDLESVTLSDKKELKKNKTRTKTSESNAPAPSAVNKGNLDVVTLNSENIQPEEGMLLYQSGKYEEALKSFNQFLKQNPNNLKALLYSGICELSLNKPNEALTIFEKIIEANQTFKEDATWYRALTLIKLQKLREAKKTLKQIVKEKGIYAVKAQETLNDLSK